jgi:hypothetical protein
MEIFSIHLLKKTKPRPHVDFEKRGFTKHVIIIIDRLNYLYFFALATGFFTAFFTAGFALAAVALTTTPVFPLPAFATAGLAAALVVTLFFALAAAALPFTIGCSLQQMISPTAQPHASSTTTTRLHTSQVNNSPFFNFAMLDSLLLIFFLGHCETYIVAICKCLYMTNDVFSSDYTILFEKFLYAGYYLQQVGNELAVFTMVCR